MVVNNRFQLFWIERYNNLMQRKVTITEEVLKTATTAVDDMSEIVKKTESRVEEVVAPVRQRVFKRFPVIFILLTTFGVTATISGMERLLFQFNILQNNPGIVLVIGLMILILTGTLYKRLG